MSSWFSGVAREYATFRPHYPTELFTALAQIAPHRELAWDCGAGNGQASVELAAHFERVVATDISEQQLAAAEPHSRVEYRVAAAEHSGLANASVALVTVAQALHWFDVDAFHAEVRRVLAPGGVVAEWCYQSPGAPEAPEVDGVLKDMDARMHTWWTPQRAHVDAGYSDLPFPFVAIQQREFEGQAVIAHWTAEQLVGYVGTWSAVTRYRNANAEDPTIKFAERLHDAWGVATHHTIRWPLVIRIGRTHDQ